MTGKKKDREAREWWQTISIDSSGHRRSLVNKFTPFLFVLLELKRDPSHIGVEKNIVQPFHNRLTFKSVFFFWATYRSTSRL
jgi:hypothetical protein